jgi:general secretion pathway protein I
VRQQGMLLLEVLLALVIFATAVTGLVSSMQWQLTALDTLRQEMLALWVADNQLITAWCEQSAIKSGQATQLNQAFSWQLTSTPQSSSSLTSNQIRVQSPGGRSVTLDAWVPVSEDKEEKDE